MKKNVFTIAITLLLLLNVKTVFSQKNIALDHFFIFTDNYLVQDTMLRELGFKPVVSHHYGQGTSSSIIFFQNFYFEFISIDDSVAFVKNNELNNLLWKKQKIINKETTSPFGIGLHLSDFQKKIPFKTFDYTQSWMRKNSFLKIANSTNKKFNEPYIFIVPEYLKWQKERYSIKRHFNKMSLLNLTSINIYSPIGKQLSNASKKVGQLPEINFINNDSYYVRIIFDNQNQGKILDFRPELPLVFEY